MTRYITEIVKAFFCPDNVRWRNAAPMIRVLVLVSVCQLLQAQTGNTSTDQIYNVPSEFQPSIKDAVKFSDMPEIKDSVKRIGNLKYGITSKPMFPKYQVQPIEAAKLQNEPLPKLYHSLLKIGYSPIYNMPMGDFWYGSTRSKDMSYGFHLGHLSSAAQLNGTGYSGFSDNGFQGFGKKFYKKHTLSTDATYERNVIHYYGYDTSLNHLTNDYTKQRYQYIEPKIQVVSHYTDSTHINHNIQVSYYNLQNLYHETENNLKLKGLGTMYVNKEKLNVNILADYYNHKQGGDTINDLITTINPSFEANGKKWHADMGLSGTIDHFNENTKFYFYPQLNAYYDVYDGFLIPYAGVNGGLIKNSLRSLSKENPFIDTTIHYCNTNNKVNIFGGLKGNLSSSTSYDAKLTYSQLDSLHYFVMNYSGLTSVHNRFSVIYDNTSLINVSGQLKHQYKDKLNLSLTGNYYYYKPKTFARAFHKPDFSLTASGIYNMQNKFIFKADLFFMGNQWAYSQVSDGINTILKPKWIKGWTDINLEAEYRYTKMLSFFARFNNIANQRYYRWERYPTQRLSFMIGLSFVPY